MSSGFIEIGKSRTRCPGHGPRLEIAPKIGKSRTEFRRAIITGMREPVRVIQAD